MTDRRISPAFEDFPAAPARPGSAMVEAPGVWSGTFSFANESAKPAGDRAPGRLAEMTWKFAYADTVGLNRKVYPYGVAREAVEAVDAKAKNGQCYGRVDHPMEWDPNAMRVTMADASHRITSAAFEDDHKTLVVRASVMDNPYGRQLMSCLESGGNPGLSQRAGALFAAATDEQKVTYGCPIDQPLDIAAVLRLVTFDVVSSPGFPDATDPVVMEDSQQEGDLMTLDELKAKFPELFRQVTEAGRADGRKEAVTAALESAKPGIIEAAVKPLNEQVAALTTEKAELTAALEHVKPVLVKFGLVNEKITNEDAARQVGELTTKLAAAQGENASLKTANEALRTDAEGLRKAQNKIAIKAKVAEAYKDNRFRDDIVIACEAATTEAEALEMAARKSAEILRYAGGSGGGVGGSSHLPDAAGTGAGGGDNRQKAGRGVFAGRMT